MAIYRFEAKVISRNGGRSSVASAAYRTGKCATSAAAYRAADNLKDERTGQSYDYSKKGGVAGAEIIVPEGAPAWMQDRGQLWNGVEKFEKRKDAQLARDFILSLPHELIHEQRVELTRDFVREQFTARGYVADIAWHSPDKGEGLNHHAHVMVPMRKVDGDSFAKTKERPPEGMHPAKAWKEELGRLREAWADTANKHLEAAGLDIRIDHRSLEARGIDREPEPKQGPLATQIERQGRESLAGNERRTVKARNEVRTRLKHELAEATAEEAKIVSLMSGGAQPEEKPAAAGEGLDWTHRAGMVAQQDSALKAFLENGGGKFAPSGWPSAADKPPDGRAASHDKQADAIDAKEEGLERLRNLLSNKIETGREDDHDRDNSRTPGGGRGGRTR